MRAGAAYSGDMKLQHAFLCAAASAVVALSGCVTQPTQTAAQPAANAGTAATLASTAGSIFGSVLQANGGAAGLMSSMGVPAAGTASNAAGVLSYCAKNNLVNATSATSLANQLLTSLGMPTTTSAAKPVATQDQGYLNGVAGMIVSPTGELFNLSQIKGNVKDKACEFVMNSAKSFL